MRKYIKKIKAHKNKTPIKLKYSYTQPCLEIKDITKASNVNNVDTVPDKKRFASESGTFNSENLLHKELKKYREIFKLSPEAIFLMDKEGKIIETNDRIQSWLGFAPEAVIGKNFAELTYLNDKNRLKAKIFFLKRLNNINNQPFEMEFFTKKKERKIGLVINNSIRDDDGSKLYDLASVTDISDRINAIEKLAENQKKYKALFDFSMDGIMIFNKDFNLLSCNDAAYKMWGYRKKNEFIKAFPSDLFTEFQKNRQRTKEFITENIELALNHGFTTFECINLNKQHEEFFTLISLNTYKINNEIQFQATIRDITQRKKDEIALIEEKERLKLIYKTIPSAIFTVDTKKNITSWNKTAEELTGFRSDEVIGKECTVFALSPCVNRCGLFSLNHTKPLYNIQCSIRRKDGEQRMISKNIDLLKDSDDNIIGGIESFEDITNQILLNNKLRDATEQANAANEAKSEFIANVSHELRTPLNSILGFSEILAEQDISEKQKSFVNNILSSGKLLLELINDILDLSKIEAGKMELRKEAVSIVHLINNISEIYIHICREKGIELIIDIHEDIIEWLLVDEVRLRQILINLVGNAVKFTGNGSVKISVYNKNVNIKESTASLIFEVSDTGIGIAESQKELIFESFMQQDNQDTRQYGGTGLGLSITKKLLKLMNGTISLKSTLGKGSTFKAELNEIMMANNKAGPDKRAYSKITFNNATIAIVSNDNHMITIWDSYFCNNNIKCIKFSKHNVTVDSIINSIPDVILMDINKWQKNDMKIVKELNNNDTISGIPIIGISAVMPGAKQGDFNDLFHSILIKPVNKEAIFTILKQLLPFEESELGADDSNIFIDLFNINEKYDIEELKKLIEKLDTSYTEQAKELSEMVDIDEIKKFREALLDLADNYKIDILANFAKGLEENIKTFDFENIQYKLKQFPGLVDSLNKHIIKTGSVNE